MAQWRSTLNGCRRCGFPFHLAIEFGHNQASLKSLWSDLRAAHCTFNDKVIRLFFKALDDPVIDSRNIVGYWPFYLVFILFKPVTKQKTKKRKTWMRIIISETHLLLSKKRPWFKLPYATIAPVVKIKFVYPIWLTAYIFAYQWKRKEEVILMLHFWSQRCALIYIVGLQFSYWWNHKFNGHHRNKAVPIRKRTGEKSGRTKFR